MDVAFFCPGNKREVRESGLCSLPGFNLSKVGHAPEMCFLKHLYIEYLTSSRPGDLNQQGITGSFLKPDTSAAACQWWGMLHVQNSTMEKRCIAVHQHFPSVHLQIPPGQHEPPFTFGQLTAPVKMSDGAMIKGYKKATSIFNWLVFFSRLLPFSPPSWAPVLGVRQRGMFSFKRRRRKRLPCLPVTLEHKELLCLYEEAVMVVFLKGWGFQSCPYWCDHDPEGCLQPQGARAVKGCWLQGQHNCLCSRKDPQLQCAWKDGRKRKLCRN